MTLKTPSFWYRQSSAPQGLREILLTPFSALYALSYTLHQSTKETYKSTIPVICVGNVVAGGTGKTPTVIAILDLIVKNGLAKNPHILIRGYGGAEMGPTLVNATRHNSWDVGDEALILAQYAPTIVGGDRANSAKLAERLGADLLLMDDGMQNPGLHKDLKLVVINGEMGFGNGKMMPAGPLRQPLSRGLQQADGFILIGEDLRESAQRLHADKPVLRANLEASTYTTLDKNASYLAFAGLGYPEKFFNFLRNEMGLKLADTVVFSDHHPYDDTDLLQLHKHAQSLNATLLTTRKDAMRLPDLEGIAVHVMPVDMRFEDEDALLALIKKVIK